MTFNTRIINETFSRQFGLNTR
uniref:Uncharacterized protein n=1 Tax=Anguilla anguilla TaxID=7936 RepID=A0A0E9RYT2_ANGAN